MAFCFRYGVVKEYQFSYKENRVIDEKIKADELQNILGLSLALPDNIFSIDFKHSVTDTTKIVNTEFSFPKNPTPLEFKSDIEIKKELTDWLALFGADNGT